MQNRLAQRTKPAPDPASEVTVFVSTVGDEPNFQECLSRLRRQTARAPVEIIRNVAPLSAAFQRMLDACRTRYYVQVDEDMLLFPRALRALHQAIAAAPPAVAIVCAGLWDCDIEEPIYGVKIYRHEIVRRFPYRDTFSCEKTQLRELFKAGYRIAFLPVAGRRSCLGEHGKHYTARTIFARWKRLLQKQRRYGTLPWVEPWPRRLAERYARTRDPRHLYALLGAAAGLIGDLPADRENDFRVTCPDFLRLAEYFPADGRPSRPA